MFYSLVQATLFTNLYSGILLFALIHGEDSRPWDSFDTMINLVKSTDYKFVIDRFNYEGNWFVFFLEFLQVKKTLGSSRK